MPRSARTRKVGIEEARRIAVRAQLLDGSASGVLDTVRRLGFLQLDPIATVATPQHLVLWSRLGTVDTAELGRLLWVERKLVEWNAFIWPIETLPLLQARMRRRRGDSAWELRYTSFLASHRGFRRYVLAELEARGPLLSRELEDRSGTPSRDHRWYGSRRVGEMLHALHDRGEIAIVGRRGGQRLWDLAERWYPRRGARSVARGRPAAGRAALPCPRRSPRARRVARPPRRRGRSCPGPGHAALAVRPADRRPRPGRGALRLPLSPRDVRPAREARVRLLRAPDSRRRPARRDGSSRGSTAPPGRSRCSAPGETRRASTSALDRLADWLGARRV